MPSGSSGTPELFQYNVQVMAWQLFTTNNPPLSLAQIALYLNDTERNGLIMYQGGSTGNQTTVLEVEANLNDLVAEGHWPRGNW